MGKKIKATKTFRVGEVVVGGIIKLLINGDKLEIQFLDYFTKDLVLVEVIDINQVDAYSKARNFVEENGTYYYADQVMKWIESKVDLNSHYMNW